ncbi:MAG: tetratricopeptide repeat protein [Sphingobacteriales bacterium]
MLFAISSRAEGRNIDLKADSNRVIKLNKLGFDMRLTDPDQTVADAGKALVIARRINYTNGIAESYRVMGIGYYYLDQYIKAINNYLMALNYFKQLNDLEGQGRIYNNIGNLYRYSDYDTSLEYFNQALSIAQKLSNKPLMATVYLNIGTVYYHKNSYYQALSYYNKSSALFEVLKDSVNMVQCTQNKGVMYYNLKEYDMAEKLLTDAREKAIKKDLNEPVASIDLTLAELYIAQNRYKNAEKTIAEGLTFAAMVKSEKMQADFKLTSYQLALKQNNFESALHYLQDIHKQDSTFYMKSSSTQINVKLEQVEQEARKRENELLQKQQAYDRVKFWAIAIVAGLLSILVGLLISNVKRKTNTNAQLTSLNSEVSRQKDNLDRINHHLEEIIDERTQDLQIKNKKLSEYSSYLSHQIRGPIATLKGLLNLEKEGLVDQHECIRMMNKSVSDIDDKIIEMSDMLHDPGRVG